MTSQEVSELGNALTDLGLEDKFISNGELTKLPLLQRGEIANGIINEKLKLGRWQSVVQMMYGGVGKADALYEGDRSQLRERILKSAVEHPEQRGFGREIIDILKKAGEEDLIFKLADLPLNYEDFKRITRSIDPSYFEDAEKGPQRQQILHKKTAENALRAREYFTAFYNFEQINDSEGIGKVFDATLDSTDIYCSPVGLLEEIALSEPSQKDERLKRIVLNSISNEQGLNPLDTYILAKKHNIELSSEEKTILQEKAVEKAGGYDITSEKLSQDEEFRLLWAKKNTKEEPRTAYAIFLKQGFNRNQVITAVKAGLEIERYGHNETVLRPEEITEPHLKRAYKTASFNVKVKIATHLKDSDELQKLSKQAHESGDLREAYNLWFAGEGNPNAEYIDRIRTKIIQDSIESDSSLGLKYFLDDLDTIGKIKAYDALMQTEESRNIREAYEMALELNDEQRTHIVREKMVAIDSAWALRNFKGKDQKGVDYVVGLIENQHNLKAGTLKTIVEKY